MSGSPSHMPATSLIRMRRGSLTGHRHIHCAEVASTHWVQLPSLEGGQSA
jgi:hypothetical protein